MKTCTFPMEIVKEEAQSLHMKMSNAELYLKEAACSRIAQTNVKVVKTKLLAIVQLRTREQAFN